MRHLLITVWAVAAVLCAEPAVAAADEEADAEPEEAVGMDWVAFPTFKGNSDAGFVYGARLEIVDHADGSFDPFAWELRMELNHSTKNRHEHFLSLDAPAWVNGARFFLQAEVLHIDDANYFGIGNETSPATDPGDNDFSLTEPRIQLQLRRDLRMLFATAGVILSLPTTEAAEGSLLEEERPAGWRGGRHLSGVAAFGIDTRDNEIVPRNGVFAEVYSRFAIAPISDYSWYGGGISESTYWAPVDWLVFAQRIMFEALAGTVPVTEMMRIGGTRNFRAIGGVYSQRGYVENRFIGPIRGIANAEIRGYLPPVFGHLVIGGGPFAGVSRVFDGSGTLAETWHPSAGGEVTIGWKKSFLFRIDYAVSPEGGEFYIEGRHLF
jgi:hypothetical protein